MLPKDRHSREAVIAEYEKLARLEAEVEALEAANPLPFPAPGAVCRCASSGGSEWDCNLVIVGKLAGGHRPCSCWCHCNGIKKVGLRMLWRAAQAAMKD